MYDKNSNIFVTKLDNDYFINSILRENLSGFSFSNNRLRFFTGVGSNIDKAKKIIEFFNGEYEEKDNELIIKNIDIFRKNVMQFLNDRINHGKEYWVVKILEFDEYSEGEWANGLETYYFETEIEARMFAFNNKSAVTFIGKEKTFSLEIDIKQ